MEGSVVCGGHGTRNTEHGTRSTECGPSHEQRRWTLAALARSCAWLQVETLAGLSQLLKRLGIGYKRGRAYVHSPNAQDQAQLSYLEWCRLRAWYAPESYVFLYLDEFSYYRQPTLAHDYELRGHHQPLAGRSYRSDTRCRGIGALNAVTGQVTYQQRSPIGLKELSAFYALI